MALKYLLYQDLLNCMVVGALYFVSLSSQDCIAEYKLILIQLHTFLIKLHNLLASLNYCILPALFLFCLCLYSHEEQVLAVCCAFGGEGQWWDSVCISKCSNFC